MSRAIIHDINLYNGKVTGGSELRSASEDLAKDIGDKLGLVTKYSSGTFADIYAKNDSQPYVRIQRTSTASGTVSLTVYKASNSYTGLTHHREAIVTANAVGPALHYVNLDNYTLIGLCSGSPKQLDIIFDKNNGAILYLSDDGLTLTMIDEYGNLGNVPTQNFIDSSNIVSLMPLAVPDLDIVYDDLFLAGYMRAYQHPQQFDIDGYSYFTSGNPSSEYINAPQFVVKI